MTDSLFIVLAAGEGTRMKSDVPKLLHCVAGRPIISHVVNAAQGAGASEIAVVVAPDRPQIQKALAADYPQIVYYEQGEQLGTAHGARMARESWQAATGYVIVVYGDHPLLRAQNFKLVLDKLDAGFDAAILAFEPKSPEGYGRLITKGAQLLAIREHKDASSSELEISLCNACALAFRTEVFRELIDQVSNNNAQGEYYLPDLAELANTAGYKVTFAIAAEQDVVGVNSRSQLAYAEALFQQRLREEAMAKGVTLIDPSSVFLSYDTELGRDVVIEPNVFIGEGVSIGDGAIVHGFSHIVGAKIGKRASVGPFARLRPDAILAKDSKVGNFCEVKKAEIGEGAKINHLSYIGDSFVGAYTNVGAGTITCNYDGVNKHTTRIGRDVFVGSNSSLVAPLAIGDGAYVASGSVVTRDVEAEALALGRSRQENKPGYASRLKARAQVMKKKANTATKENR